MKRACVALFFLMAAAAAVPVGCGTMFKNIREAAEPDYYWTREKVFKYTVDDKTIQFEEDAALKALPQDYTGQSVTTLPGITFAPATESLLPVDVGAGIPKEYTKRLDSFLEVYPASVGRATVLKSKNGEWNRELFFALNEQDAIALQVEGPKKIMVLSMLSINRDEALYNTRKYIYAIEDETGAVTEAPAYANRRNDILFYSVDSESASTPHVYMLEVPEGTHSYIFKYKYSDAGDILLKFFEAVYSK